MVEAALSLLSDAGLVANTPEEKTIRWSWYCLHKKLQIKDNIQAQNYRKEN